MWIWTAVEPFYHTFSPVYDRSHLSLVSGLIIHVRQIHHLTLALNARNMCLYFNAKLHRHMIIADFSIGKWPDCTCSIQ